MSGYYHYYKNIFGGTTRVSFEESENTFVITEEHAFSEKCSDLKSKKLEAVEVLVEKLRDEVRSGNTKQLD